MKIKRTIKYYYRKLLRATKDPHHLGLAVAIGMFIGCIIPIGLWGQTALAIILAIKMRVNPGVAYAATWISNPYSVIFMYPAFCYVGGKIIGSGLTFEQMKNMLHSLFTNFTWANFKEVGSEFAIAYLVGSVVFGIICSIIGYYGAYYLLKRHNNKKRRLKGTQYDDIK